MGMPYFSNAGTFLISTVFGIYILIVMLRFVLQLVRADFYNPVSQFLVKVTAPPLKHLRRYIPGYSGIDLASIVLMLALQSVQWWLVLLISGITPTLGGIFFLSIADLLALAANIFLVSIIIQIVISWINPGSYNPITSLLYHLNEPLMAPARRLLPPVSGLDFSPILVIICLQLFKMLVSVPIHDLGQGLLR
ncbi:MAG: YggT family protein [Gammaproteobacteria bacterium]|nr:YggT family protein [Gammaproteobacteria bacterium]